MYLTLKESNYDQDLVTKLINIDLELGFDIDKIVAGCWKQLRSIESGMFLDKIQEMYPTPYNNLLYNL